MIARFWYELRRAAEESVATRIRSGELVHPNDLPCAVPECKHIWARGRHHQYHHPNGYLDPLVVQPVCWQHAIELRQDLYDLMAEQQQRRPTGEHRVQSSVWLTPAEKMKAIIYGGGNLAAGISRLIAGLPDKFGAIREAVRREDLAQMKWREPDKTVEIEVVDKATGIKLLAAKQDETLQLTADQWKRIREYGHGKFLAGMIQLIENLPGHLANVERARRQDDLAKAAAREASRQEKTRSIEIDAEMSVILSSIGNGDLRRGLRRIVNRLRKELQQKIEARQQSAIAPIEEPKASTTILESDGSIHVPLTWDAEQ